LGEKKEISLEIISRHAICPLCGEEKEGEKRRRRKIKRGKRRRIERRKSRERLRRPFQKKVYFGRGEISPYLSGGTFLLKGGEKSVDREPKLFGKHARFSSIKPSYLQDNYRKSHLRGRLTRK
jgi:hypothetical protein